MATGTLIPNEVTTVEWLLPDYIIGFRLWDDLHSQKKVDYFCELVQEVIEFWRSDHPWLVLFDHSQVESPTWTPYLQESLERTLLQIPNSWTGRSATVMNYTSRTYVVKAYLEYRFQRQQPQIEQRLLLGLPQAIRWLEAGLPEGI